MPLFSIVIPAYNREQTIAQTLESVFAQQWPDYEVIVVDDGSSDGTCAVVSGYGDRIRLLRQQNRGPGSARNLGVAHASGRYVAFLDSDDLWAPWTLQLYERALRETDYPAVMTSRWQMFTDPHTWQPTEPVRPVIEQYERLFDFPIVTVPNSASLMTVRRDALNEIDGFYEFQPWVLGEETDVLFRLGDRRFTYLREPAAVGYRQHDANAMSDTRRIVDGIKYRLNAEKQGGYPGRRHEARRMLCQLIRYHSRNFLETGNKAAAWELYRASFTQQLSVGRLKYLAGFPILCGAKAVWNNGKR